MFENNFMENPQEVACTVGIYGISTSLPWNIWRQKLSLGNQMGQGDQFCFFINSFQHQQNNLIEELDHHQVKQPRQVAKLSFPIFLFRF